MLGKQPEDFEFPAGQIYHGSVDGHLLLGLVDPQRTEFIDLSRSMVRVVLIFSNHVLELFNHAVSFFIAALDNNHFRHCGAPFATLMMGMDFLCAYRYV